MPCRLGTHPLSYFEVLYFFQYFPRLSPPPLGHSLGRVIGQFEWIETVVQPVGLTVELPVDDLRLSAFMDVDQEVSRNYTTRRAPGASEMTCGTVFCLLALVGHYITVVHPRIFFSLVTPLVVRLRDRRSTLGPASDTR